MWASDQLVENPIKEFRDPCLNPGLFHHYVSHPIIFAAMATPTSDSLTLEKEPAIFKVEDPFAAEGMWQTGLIKNAARLAISEIKSTLWLFLASFYT